MAVRDLMSVAQTSNSNAVFDSLRLLTPVVRYPRGVELCKQGEFVKNVYLIEKGLVAAAFVAEDGRQHFLDYYMGGWMIGAASFLIRSVFPATMTTIVPSMIRILPGPVFAEELKSNQTLSEAIHRMHAWELREQHRKAVGLALWSVRQRLERFLWCILNELPSEYHCDGRTQIPFSSAEMAHFVASSPQRLSEVFSELEQEGILKRSRGWLIVEDKSRLWHG
jgi:CRP-like cAMP-binding protein